MASDSSLLSVRIPDELRAKLDEAARRMRRSRGHIVKEALEQHLGSGNGGETSEERAVRVARFLAFAGAGAKLHGGRTAREIDEAIRQFRGDE